MLFKYHINIREIPSQYSQVPFSVEMNVPHGEYSSLIELGEILEELASQSPAENDDNFVFKPRQIAKHILQKGKQNLIIVDAGILNIFMYFMFNYCAIFVALIWKSLLFLYMADPEQPLPTYEEVIICTEETTAEEVGGIIVLFFMTLQYFYRLPYSGIAQLMIKNENIYFVWLMLTSYHIMFLKKYSTI